MKKTKLNSLLFCTFFFGFILFSHAQSVNFPWAKSGNVVGGKGVGAWCKGNCTDNNGNVITVGFFNSVPLTIGGIVLTNAGANDIFVVKYSQTGTVLWAESFGGAGGEMVEGVSTDADDNILITGTLLGPLTIGNTVLNNNGPGLLCYYIIKLSPAGNVIWAKSAASGKIYPYALSVDPNRNIWVTGRCDPGVDFGNGLICPPSAADNLFVAKYDSSGNLIWSFFSPFNISPFSMPWDIKNDASGNGYIAGYFGGTTMTIGSYVLNNPLGDFTFYLAKLDPSGQVMWAKCSVDSSAHSYANEYGGNLFIEANGNILMSGSFGAPFISFDGHILSNPSPVFQETFIVKYDPNGNVIWVKSTQGPLNERGTDMAADAAGNIYLSGMTDGPSISFDNITINTPPLTGGCTSPTMCLPLFLAKYDSNGIALCATILTSGGKDSYLSMGPLGEVMVSGTYTSDPLFAGNISLPLTGGDNNFFTGQVEFTCGTTGVNDVNESSIIIYPNPVQDELYISGLSNDANLFLYDVAGKQVLSSYFANTSHTLSTKTLAEGIYFLEIRFRDGNKMYRKILKGN